MKSTWIKTAILTGLIAATSLTAGTADFTYECGESDFNIDVDTSAKVLAVYNDHCHAKMTYQSTTGSKATFKVLSSKDSSSPCGSGGVIDHDALDGQAPILFELIGGRDQGFYHCVLK